MPPRNQQRRDLLADAAIDIIVAEGLHGLSHRTVDVRADVPRGTTSNYFRSRESLLEAIVRRIVHLHFELIDDLRAGATGGDGLTELLGDVVEQALGRFKGRYVALFELALESTRRPELQEAFARISGEAMTFTREAHRTGGHEPPAEEIALLNAFYNGVLFTSLVMPQALGGRTPGEVTRAMLRRVLDQPSQAQLQ
ncbi:TetR/AcrR family transcriptional regulator [Nonomuraea rosea]|uniref:TetR/AcrR family transcriptional regulator n=1 Tax=Nonomuraea rosea TaxID=638574 RepID=A0ABP6XHK4_9ACTN